MALKTAPVLPRIEDSSFDQLAFSNYIMNEADIGLNPAATQRAPTTPPPKPEFSFAEPDAAAPYGAPSTSGASLAASLEMSKTYGCLQTVSTLRWWIPSSCCKRDSPIWKQSLSARLPGKSSWQRWCQPPSQQWTRKPAIEEAFSPANANPKLSRVPRRRVLATAAAAA